VTQSAAADQSTRSSRKERGHEHVRRDIEKAAASAFARRGFHGATMEEIAREAGYSVGSLYTYFASKEELYHSMLLSLASEMEAVARRPVPSSLSFRQRFESLLLQQLELVERNRELLLAFLSHRAKLDWEIGGEIGELVRQLYMQNIELTATTAAAAMAEGTLTRAAPRDVAYFVVDVVYGAVLRWASGDLPGSLVSHAPVLMRLIFNGIGVRENRVGVREEGQP
jgi:AcrR family transcriptional regulator